MMDGKRPDRQKATERPWILRNSETGEVLLHASGSGDPIIDRAREIDKQRAISNRIETAKQQSELKATLGNMLFEPSTWIAMLAAAYYVQTQMNSDIFLDNLTVWCVLVAVGRTMLKGTWKLYLSICNKLGV